MGRTDLIGWLLLALLAALAFMAGTAIIRYAHLTPWSLVLGLFICLAFVAVGLPAQVSQTPKNTLVHGAARPATTTSRWPGPATTCPTARWRARPTATAG